MAPGGADPATPPPADPRELIARKRDGGSLARDEIAALVRAYVADELPDEQMAALLMAGVIRGFTRGEAVALTEALLASGAQLDLGGLAGPTVDKHSTGGVGDTTTLIVGPVLAACGMQVVKLAGRALAHTGGTIDKLAAIPGMGVRLTAEELTAQAEDVGLVVAAATDELVPADKRLYALRDRTATVASPALIASSVMSKKLAGGARHLVLDVKAGSGGLLPADPDGQVLRPAGELAELCVSIGRARGRRTAALVTDMSQPLGQAIGDALEVAAAVDILRGEHTRGDHRLREVSVELAVAGLQLSGLARSDALERARQALDSGRALEVFRRFVAAQGGDPAVATQPRDVLPQAPVVRPWEPPAGVVTALDCRGVGALARRLAAPAGGPGGDPAAGLRLAVGVGEEVGGRPAAWVHAGSREQAASALQQLEGLVTVGDGGPVPAAAGPVHRRIGLSGA